MQKNMSSFCFVCFLKLNMLCGKSCLVLPNVRGIHYLFGKARCCNDRRNFVFLLTERHNIIYILQYSQFLFFTSQRSLHNAPIFRLLLKVAVNGTHQCDFLNFWRIPWIPTLIAVLLYAILCMKCILNLPDDIICVLLMTVHYRMSKKEVIDSCVHQCEDRLIKFFASFSYAEHRHF